MLRFLEGPLTWHPAGRMPDFRLTEMEASDLAAFLSSLRILSDGSTLPEPELQMSTLVAKKPEMAARGKQLVEQLRCAACHDIEGVSTPPVLSRSLDRYSGELHARGCLRVSEETVAAPNTEKSSSPPGPRFTLSNGDRSAVGEFLRQRPLQAQKVAKNELAEQFQHNRLLCDRCHTSDGSGGEQLGRALLRHVGPEAGSAQQLAAATPPDLSGVGAKLRPDWIHNVLTGKAASPRPWLTVRMPKFALSDAERIAIVDRLVITVAIPESTDSPVSAPLDAAAAQALLSSGGFSCQTCHFLGSHWPSADTMGPNLALVGQRLSRGWFMRWLENPARIRPGTTMPALVVPATKVAGGDLAMQKEILWNYLSRTPADQITVQGEAPRTVAVIGERATVVQGRVLGESPFNAVRGVAVGLPNGHSLLFDGSRLAWLGHWHGSFLREVGLHGARHH
jgi:cytochrome c2